MCSFDDSQSTSGNPFGATGWVSFQRRFSQTRSAFPSPVQLKQSTPSAPARGRSGPAYGGWRTLGSSSPSTSSHGKISHSWTGGIGRRPPSPTAATTRAWISSGDSGMATCCHGRM